MPKKGNLIVFLQFRFLYLIALMTAVLLWSASFAYSDLLENFSLPNSPDTFRQHIVELERIVVTATKSTMNAEMVDENAEVLTQEDVKSSGASNINKLFYGIHGVDIDPNRTQTNIMII